MSKVMLIIRTYWNHFITQNSKNNTDSHLLNVAIVCQGLLQTPGHVRHYLCQVIQAGVGHQAHWGDLGVILGARGGILGGHSRGHGWRRHHRRGQQFPWKKNTRFNLGQIFRNGCIRNCSAMFISFTIVKCSLRVKPKISWFLTTYSKQMESANPEWCYCRPPDPWERRWGCIPLGICSPSCWTKRTSNTWEKKDINIPNWSIPATSMKMSS